MPTTDTLRRNAFRILAHAGALAPLAWLLLRYANSSLGVNPIQKVIQETGLAGIQILMLSIACTPLATLGLRQAVTVRRAFGLYGFLYIALHVLAFSVLDFGLDLELIGLEIVEKPYIIAGLSAFGMLVPLAITSTRGWQQRLGKAWRKLHRLFYIALPLGVLHFWWSQKADLNQALLIYAPILAALLIVRLPALRRAIAARRR